MNTFEPTFRFKEFGISDRRCGMKTGTDGVLLGAWAECPRPDGDILDVGAGCGLISLMLAQRYPLARVKGVEVDPGAVADFRENLAYSPWRERVMAVEGDFRSVEGSFDLIVSNPPFFTNGEIAPEESRARARHAGELSPLALPRFAAAHMNPCGRLALITPVETASALELECALAKLSVVRKVKVATSRRRGVTRLLWEIAHAPAKRRERKPISVGGPEYEELTRPFYLHYS